MGSFEATTLSERRTTTKTIEKNVPKGMKVEFNVKKM
jgi:hypothetical protein